MNVLEIGKDQHTGAPVGKSGGLEGPSRSIGDGSEDSGYDLDRDSRPAGREEFLKVLHHGCGRHGGRHRTLCRVGIPVGASLFTWPVLLGDGPAFRRCEEGAVDSVRQAVEEVGRPETTAFGGHGYEDRFADVVSITPASVRALAELAPPLSAPGYAAG
jgi:hypothetical protein